MSRDGPFTEQVWWSPAVLTPLRPYVRRMARQEDWSPPEERILHALGQLHRLSSEGRLPVKADEWDPVDVAAVLGISETIELIVEHPFGTAHHFKEAVLVTYPDIGFPWALEDPAIWAAYCDTVDERWAENHRPDRH